MRSKRFLSLLLSLSLTFSFVHGIINSASAVGEEPEQGGATLHIISRRVSKPALYANVPDAQKTVSASNPIAVENAALQVEITDAETIDYIHFSGDSGKPTSRKANAGAETIDFVSQQKAVEGVTDWENLSIAINDAPAAFTAANFKGEGTNLTFTVPTVPEQERSLTIYAGGHPHTGTITTAATLGGKSVPVVAGDSRSDTYELTPNSSQITEYQLDYTGTGQDLVVTFTLKGTQDMDWAGIAVAGAVLRGKDVPAAHKNVAFNKNPQDVEHTDVHVRISNTKDTVLKSLLLQDAAVPQEGYAYDAAQSTITLYTDYLDSLGSGSYELKAEMGNGQIFSCSLVISDSTDAPRPFVKDVNSLSEPDLDAWKLWFRDEFTGKMSDWWEPSYLKWWNYSTQSNEKYNQIEHSDAAGSDVLKQFITPDMRADSIVTRRDNFRNPGITLGAKDLIHNYGAKDLLNLQHVPVDDRGATAYGYFEIRAKITGGTTDKTQSGSSAWWFTGFQDAPWQTVEVDMVEYGYGVTEENLNAHFASPMHRWRDPFVSENNSTWNSTDKDLGVDKPADGYHVYGYEWTPTGMNGYFDGTLVWSKKVDVNYRMLMWLSLNSHAYDTYTPDDKAHYIDYVRIWKTKALEELEKKLVTKNIIQKQAPIDGNIATLGYCGANGVRSSHYQVYDPAYMNDGDPNTSYRAMTRSEREQDAFPVLPYPSDAHFLYLDWVEYPDASNASTERETIKDLDGKTYTFASEQEIQSAKTVSAVTLVVNKQVLKKTIDPQKSDNAKGSFVYATTSETANLFPYRFDIECSEDGIKGWTPIASDVTAQWDFDNEGMAAYTVNIPAVPNVHHLRLHVKSVWNSDTAQEESTENGFYVAEIQVYETAKGMPNAERKAFAYNHAPFAQVSVADANGALGSEDINFPVTDLADGVSVNTFRSSGDGTRRADHPNRVDVTKDNIPAFPQYISFQWDAPRTIDSMGLNIGERSAAPTRFRLEALQADGTWKAVIDQTEVWEKDFQKKTYPFEPQTTSQMRLVILEANRGQPVEYQGGIEGDPSRIVCIAGGYYAIAEVELNETK